MEKEKCCEYCIKYEKKECPVKDASPWSRWKNFCSEFDDGCKSAMCVANSNAVLGEVPSESLCEICFKKIDNLNGNPDFWGVALPYQNGNGKMKYYHRGCVANIIARHVA